MSHYIVDEGAREKLAEGVNLVANIVSKTLGVKGRNVALDTDKYSYPLLTNDGVSIARNIVAGDDGSNVGRKLIIEAANKTEDNAGDGTSTTILLMQELVNEGIKEINAGRDPLELRTEIEKNVSYVVDYIKDHAKPAKEEIVLAQTATISSRDPVIGKLVANAVVRAKEDGLITLEDNLGGETEIVEQTGLRLLTGFAAKQFVNNVAQQQVVLSNASMLVTNLNLNGVAEFQFIAEQAGRQGHKVLVVFGQNIGAEFMMWCHLNWQRQDAPLKILPVQFNTAADLADGMLRDVAAVSGGMMIDTLLNQGLEQLEQEGVFGRVKRFIQEKKLTIVEPMNTKHVEDRVKELKLEFKASQDYQAENISERIARLRSACFTIKVGGTTITEMRELKTRVRDALNSAKAAYAEGVVKGGGMTLYPAASQIEGVVFKACIAPANQQAKNSSMEIREWTKSVLDNPEILDPARVVIEAIQNAGTQAIQLLLTEAIIVDPKVNEE